MIHLERITYAYPDSPVTVMHQFSWTAAAGAFVLVAGHTGSGKSTLLRCLNGLVPHFYGGRFGGSVRVAGQDAVALGPAGMSATVGFVFQDPEAQAVLPVVEEEIAFGLENLGTPPTVMRRRVEEVLDLLGIAHLRQREVSTLSGGERQRVALAAVLAMQPPVLVLDEPTSQLDPLGAEEVLTALERLNSDLGVTIVLAEHRLERVLGYAEQLLYLPGDGQPARDGPVRETLRAMPLVPPMIDLARRLEWEPLPLTIRDGRRLAATHHPLQLPDPVARPAPGDPPALRVRNLTFRYERQRVLNEVDLRVEPGELVALMGRNGAGKSTLLRLIMGLIRPSRGGIEIAGQPIERMQTADIAGLAGYVPQHPGTLLFSETVRAELEYTRQHQLSARTTDIDTLLATFDLTSLAGHYPRDLSIGQQQRVALATMLVARPRLLLLDEPTRGMDYLAKQNLSSYLKILRQAGTAIILATHDVELVARCADRVVILGAGEIVADGPPRQVLASSLIFAPQINRLFGGEYLLPDDVIDTMTAPARA